jgi:hypothetical protein
MDKAEGRDYIRDMLARGSSADDMARVAAQLDAALGDLRGTRFAAYWRMRANALSKAIGEQERVGAGTEKRAALLQSLLALRSEIMRASGYSFPPLPLSTTSPSSPEGSPEDALDRTA